MDGSTRAARSIPPTLTPRWWGIRGEWKKGQLAKDVSYRLIVTGNVGVKEIEQLIKHLELEKEMLANQE